MTTTLTAPKPKKSAYPARRLRVAALLSRQELADLAGVPREHVEFLERHLPLPLDSKRRILRELWARKYKK